MQNQSLESIRLAASQPFQQASKEPTAPFKSFTTSFFINQTSSSHLPTSTTKMAVPVATYGKDPKVAEAVREKLLPDYDGMG